MHVRTIALVIAAVLLAEPAWARRIEGVSVQESFVVPGAETPALTLNGAGVRQRFLRDIYIASLYLPRKTSDVRTILDERGPKSINVHFLYKEVAAQRLIDGWVDGFRFNHTEAEFSALSERLAQLNAVARDVHRGETIRLDLLPGGDTRMIVNDKPTITIPGADFQRALLKIWLGEKPVDDGLKRAMLGLGE